MSTELEKPPARALDGFDAWGDDEDYDSRTDSLVKFTNDSEWIANDEVLSPELELVAVNVDRYVIYWKPDGSGPDRAKGYYLKPGEKFPDIEQLNADTPKSEWREAFGKLQGPWQAQHIVRLLDPVTMDRYSFPTATDGGHTAVLELRQRTRDMRRVRGEHAFALVRLRDTFFPTRYGGRQRPFFEIVRFVTFGDDGSTVITASDTPSLVGPMKTVETPSAKETVQDEIAF
jgi:hypothetical protein